MLLPLRFLLAAAAALLMPFARSAAANPPNALPKPRIAPALKKRGSLLSPSEYLPVSEIKAGMKGYGLTVFHGSRIERFDVTILGVLHRANNGRDLILVKLSGPNMGRVTDVIAGMSGSPVYINGKIVGAVAYGSKFTREAIGYLTPIEDMLDAWDPALPQFTPAAAAAPLPSTTSPAKLSELRPLGTKVTVSGVPQSRFAQVTETLQKLGLEARSGGVSGGGGALLPPQKGVNGSPLQPGGAIALSLATGDLDITGIGTLTYRRGREVVAFGHPFLGIGPIDAPMFSAYIHDIEPSFSESHKIGSPVALVGAFSQDRPFSLGGRIGAVPVMTPITVHVRDTTQSRDHVFHAKLVRHPQLTPVLAPMAAGTAIVEVHGQPGDAMATVTTTVIADEIGTITRTNRFFDASAIDAAATGDLSALMNLLTSNPFYPLGVRSVKMEVVIEPGRQTAQVERIFLKQTRFAPGETVEIGVVLKPYKQERVTQTMRLRLPANTPNGTLLLSVQGGGSGGGTVLSLGGLTFRAPVDLGNTATMAQLVRRYTERERNDELTAKITLPTAAVSVQGETLAGLPAHIEAAMRGESGGTARTSNVHLERAEVKTSFLTPYVLSGAQTLAIRVVRPGTLPEGQQSRSGVSGAGSDGSSGSVTVFPPAAGGGSDERFAQRSNSGSSSDPPPPPITIPVGPPPPSQSPAATAEPVRVISSARTAASERTIAPAAAAAAPLAKAVGRMPGIWQQSGASDFRAGTLEGVTVTSSGDVRLAPRMNLVAESTEPFFWCLAPDGDNGVFVGSGDNGVVYQVGNGSSNNRKLTAFAQTGEWEVHSLVRASDGTLFAGTSPHGKVFRIGSDGKPHLLLQTGEKYVFALALSPAGDTLYVGTGSGGGGISRAKVYAVTLHNGAAKTLYESDEGSVTALAVAPGESGGGNGGDLYAGTAPGGLVIKIGATSSAKPQVVYDAAEAAITGLTVDKNGVVYAAAFSPRGVLYRLAPGEAARILYETGAPVGTLANLQLSPEGTLYTASGSTLIAVSPDTAEVRTTVVPQDIQILSLLLGQAGKLWAATGSIGSVYALNASGDESGKLTSPVFDARTTATWGTARLRADNPAHVYLQTRSGNSAQPDSSWSDWSRALPAAGSSGEVVPSPPGRYLQWRATLEAENNSSGSDKTAPALRGVEVFYRTPNQAPKIALLAPRGGEVLRGTQTIRWSGTDPDKDTLAFRVEISGDNGKTWQPLQASPTITTRVVSSAPSVLAEKQAEEQRMIRQVEAELDNHPEISPEMRARILADTPRQLRDAVNSPSPPQGKTTTAAETTAVAASPVAALRETSVPLDTVRLPDGAYQVRIIASDKPANPEGELTATAVSGDFRIVNRPPLLISFHNTITVKKDRSVRIEGVALHPAGILVRAVQFRADNDKDWTAASPQDGIFDGTLEQWFVVTTSLAPGPHTISVQALDEAGNAVTLKIAVQVP